MRGKVLSYISAKFNYRITPAYAGKRQQFEKKPIEPQDHPRLCGEKPALLHGFSHCMGSPPPMRGKVHQNTVNFYQSWITPAYAGKSNDVAILIEWAEDHPRLCGEKEC